MLVVDDEKDAREFVNRLLVECQAVPQLAASAEEAKQLLESFKPDLILSDIGMPVEDGYEFMREYPPQRGEDAGHRASRPLPARTIVCGPWQAGYQIDLAKPIEPAELIETVASLAEHAKAV